MIPRPLIQCAHHDLAGRWLMLCSSTSAFVGSLGGLEVLGILASSPSLSPSPQGLHSSGSVLTTGSALVLRLLTGAGSPGGESRSEASCSHSPLLISLSDFGLMESCPVLRLLTPARQNGHPRFPASPPMREADRLPGHIPI